jgi:hypothetical protein
MPEKPDYDQSLMFSLIADPDGFLDIFVPGLKHQETLSSELPEIPRQADEAWKVELPDGTIGLLHIELQTDPDQKMANGSPNMLSGSGDTIICPFARWSSGCALPKPCLNPLSGGTGARRWLCAIHLSLFGYGSFHQKKYYKPLIMLSGRSPEQWARQ